MKTGDLFLTTNFKARTEPVKPRLEVGWKAERGSAFLCLNFGTVKSLDEVDDRVKRVMSHLGWIACDDVAGLRRALNEARNKEVS
jgi:hypothetical protein